MFWQAHLEKQILKYLDEPIPSTGVDGGVRWAGRVYAVLPLPGQGGPKTQGHAEARTHQLSKLLSLAHSVMDYLFEGIIEKEVRVWGCLLMLLKLDAVL